MGPPDFSGGMEEEANLRVELPFASMGPPDFSGGMKRIVEAVRLDDNSFNGAA